MLINNHINSNKTEILIENYAKLLNSGISADEILVLVQNFKKKNEFIEKTKTLLKKDAISAFNVYTFFGLCYNSILENWCILENKINDQNPCLVPNLSGLEVSQYIFKNAINEVQFKGYNSKGNLLHQLLRRYCLTVLNALTPDEVKERAKILSDPFYTDINRALNMYKKKTLELRAFDYLRQTDMFSFVYKNTVNPYKYVFLDDADEITPALFEYLKHIKPDIKEFFIAYDKFGCTRKGFLGALEFDFEKFTGEIALNSAQIEDDKQKEKSKKGFEIFSSVIKNSPFELQNATIESFIREDEMVKKVTDTINALLQDPKKRLKPSDFAIVTPNIDDYLKILLEKINAPVNYLTGSGKLSKNPTLSLFLEILNLLNNKNLKISAYTLRGILAKILNLDFETTLKITAAYEADDKEVFELLGEYKTNTACKTPDIQENGKILETDEPRQTAAAAGEKIENFLNLLDEIRDFKLSDQLFALADNYIEKNEKNTDIIYKINQLLKQIRDFEEIFKTTVSNRELLSQLENTIVSENPITGANAGENSICVATAQKLIDNSITSKYTFLLDTTSSNWTKQDIGPLYNAWVFQKSWKKPKFELQDNINCALDKTARILRKIFLLNEGQIYVYSSIYDFLGQENFKGINHFFKNPDKKDEPAKKEFKIVPRKDQAPVLEYEGGKMAVSAVAGAGKTTIMLALILKLLNKKIPPENIFVLTFMDSAARNFKERIKENFPNLVELPHISTIHGLALRILRENNNHVHLNLDVDFEILDETKRSAIIREIVCNMGLSADKSELYERAISAYKNQKHPNPEKMTPVFKRVYEEYKTVTISGNFVDYDDLLALSLALLRQNKSVREYYQNLMKFIIEDEAQDSSEIQQELIKILAEKNKNLIRTGDVNQAITTTFSNADVKGFKAFIKENKNVKMNFSNRNATGIINFANNLIKYGENVSPGAFLPITTMPVKGKNIVDNFSVDTKIFDTEKEEKNFILNKINEIAQNDKGASIGILLRSNKSVADWSAFLELNTKMNVETNSDTLDLNPVFRCVLAVLNFVNNPLGAEFEKCTKSLISLGFYRRETEILEKFRPNFAVQNNAVADNSTEITPTQGSFENSAANPDAAGTSANPAAQNTAPANNDRKNTPFILQNNEDFSLWWDLKYFLSRFGTPVYELAYKIGEFYFSNNIAQKANIPMVSAIVSKIFNTEKTFEDTVKKLNSIAKKPNRTGIRLIKSQNTETGAIQVMTLHKSKGDEYDYTFIPEMYKDNLPLALSDVKIKENSKFIESIKTEGKTEAALKKEALDENFRLAYVGITRAKKKLYITCAKEYTLYNKKREKDPNDLFKIEKGAKTKPVFEGEE